jgi:heat shock protein HtpX
MFWQIIAANRRKTVFLILLMGMLLAAVGYAAGILFDGFYSGFVFNVEQEGLRSSRDSGIVGFIIALMIWLGLLIAAFFSTESIFLSLTGAREVSREMYPQLYNVVEEIKIAAAVNKMPRIFITEDTSPNAFALGKSPDDGIICVTAGLLAICGRDELQGVIAHEMGHIINRDVLYMGVAATMLGAITFIADAFFRSSRYMPIRRYRSSVTGKKSPVEIWLFIIAFALIVLSPILSRILYFSISRKREFLADATSARLTRYPEGLASALEKIMLSTSGIIEAPRAAAPFYIVNPYKLDLDGGLFATHPPLGQRIKTLRSMTSGASYKDYVKAYWGVTGTHRNLIPLSDMHLGEKVGIRQPSAENVPGFSSIERRKKAGDIIRALNGFAFVNCSCGMKIKTPPEIGLDFITCPKCGEIHKIPDWDKRNPETVIDYSSALGGSSEMNLTVEKPSSPQVVGRDKGSWQRIKCLSCGKDMQVSPAFHLDHVQCSKCGVRIDFT